MSPEKFGKNLKEVMKALGMNQTEFAQRLGVTQACISQILTGKREPSLRTICLILRIIPVKFERLVKL